MLILLHAPDGYIATDVTLDGATVGELAWSQEGEVVRAARRGEGK